MRKIATIIIIALLSIITIHIKETYAYWDNTPQQSETIVIGEWAYAWNSTTTYAIGNIVTYNNIIYIAIKTGRNKVPSSTSQFWNIY